MPSREQVAHSLAVRLRLHKVPVAPATRQSQQPELHPLSCAHLELLLYQPETKKGAMKGGMPTVAPM